MMKIRQNIRAYGAYAMLSIVFVLLTNLGQINFALRATDEYRYLGSNPYAALDKLVYMNMIQQGREGRLFMRNVHTIEPQEYRMLSPLWYLIGQTGAIFHVSNNAAYQLYRVLFAVAFCWLLYAFLGVLFTNSRDRLLAALTVFFAGGFGWYYLFKNTWLLQSSGMLRFLYQPVDIYVTEGSTLLNFAQAPLFGFSQVAILASMYLFVSRRENPHWIIDSANALLVAILGVMHPYDLPILFVVLGSWSVWDLMVRRTWQSIGRLFILAAGGGVAMAYNFSVLLSEPVIAAWYRQNLVYSPPIANYLWAYGPLLVLAAVGLVTVRRERAGNPWWALVALWAVLVPVLLYLPIDVNRRFINGWHIALAIMAFAGARYLYTMVQRVWLRVVYVCFVIISLGSSLSLYAFVNLYFHESAYAHGYYYQTSAERHVIAYLREVTSTDDHLLTSDMITSFTLISQLDRLVFIGHDHQTPQRMLKQQQIDWFFSEPSTEESIALRKEFLMLNSIDYIIVSNQRLERSVRWLDASPFVEQVLSAGPYVVYRVISS